MAATVEGAFVIIDRASSALRKIKREAEKTDLAVKGVGDRLDRVGNAEQLRGLSKSETEVRNLGRSSKTSERDVDRLGSTFNRTEKSAGRLRTRLGELGAAMRGLSVLMKPGLFAGIGVAIGVALQAVRALSAGIVALIPKLTDLAGLAATAPAAFGAMAGAMVTAKLAFHNLGQAMGGNKKALQSLTPEARKFLQTLKGMHGTVQSLRSAAQRGLFPGLDKSLQDLRKATPMAKAFLQRMGGAMGNAASNFTAAFTTPERLRDLQGFGNQAIRIFSRASGAGTDLAGALLDIVRAAAPLTDWLSKSIALWAKHTAATVHAKRESGALAQYFDRVKASTQRLWSILSNLWNTMRNIGAAARPLGDSLYKSIDRVTQRWADWSGSFHGQNELRQWFIEAKAPLEELGGLVGDLGKAIASTPMDGFTSTVRALRNMIPDLQKGFGMLASFGPDLAEAIHQVVRLLGNLLGSAGPVTMVLRAFTNILNVLNDIVERIPQLGALLTAGVTMAAFVKIRTAVADLAAKWGLVATNAGRAAAAERTALMGGAGPAGAAAAAGGGGAAVFGRTAGGARTVGGLTMAERYQRFGWQRQMAAEGGAGPMRSLIAGGGAAALGLGGAARGALGAAGRFLWPVAGLGALLGAAQGTGGQGLFGLGQNVASGATFGLVPAAVKMPGDEVTGHAYRAALESARTGGVQNFDANGSGYSYNLRAPYAGINPTTGANIRNPLTGSGALPGIDRATGDFTGKGVGPKQATQIASGLQRLESERRATAAKESGDERKATLGEIQALSQLRQQYLGLAQARKNVITQRDLHTVDVWSSHLDRAFNIESKRRGFDRAFKDMTSDFNQTFTGLGRSGRVQIARNMLSWARVQAQQNPKLKGLYDQLADQIRGRFRRMGSDIQVVNGRVYDSTSQAWGQIRDTMITNAQRARIRTGEEFDKVYQKAIGALQQMGFTGGQARGIIRAQASGINVNVGTGKGQTSPAYLTSQAHRGKDHATGGRIAGNNLHDVYQMGGDMVGGQELVVNRHTESRVDKALGRFGTTLEREVNREGRPHSYPMVGENAGMPGHAQSGRTGPISVGHHNARPAATAVVPGHPELHSGISQTAEKVLQRFPGLLISSTTGGTHASGSYHYKGEATDISGDPATMLRAAGWIRATMARGLTEGIHNPNLSIKYGHAVPSSYWGSDVWAGHADHIHLAVTGGAATGGIAGGGGAGVVTAPHITAGTIDGAGPMVGGANVALQAYTKQMNKRLQHQAAKMSGGVAGGDLNFKPGKGALSRSQVERLWVAAGGPPGMAHQMANIAWSESRWNPNAQNASGASGLWQILGNPFPGNPLDPMTNARMAVAKWRAAGGLSPWDASKAVWSVRNSAPAHALGGRRGGRRFATGGRRGSGRPHPALISAARSGDRRAIMQLADEGGQLPGLARGGRLAKGGRGGGNYGAMVSKASKINAAHYPYQWGGGHGTLGHGPYDCSGAVSAVMGAGGYMDTPATSGALAHMFQPGAGDVTVFANAGHTFMRLKGRYFGTSHSNPGGGAGWMPDPGAGYRQGFAQRHVNASGGGGTLDSVKAQRAGRVAADRHMDPYEAALQGTVTQPRAPKKKKSGGGAGSLDNVPGSLAKYNRIFPSHRYPKQGQSIGPGGTAAIGRWAGLPDYFPKIAHGESGWQPGIWNVDPNGVTVGRGLFAITSPFGDAATKAAAGSVDHHKLFNPLINALAARYMLRHASSQTPKTQGFPWFGTRYLGTGGRTSGTGPEWGGWHAAGGSGTFRRPTVIGVGDRPFGEKVTVTPAGGSHGRSSGGGGVRIGQIIVQNHRPGDIEKQLRAELDRAFSEFAGKVHGAPGEDEKELVR